MSNRMGIQRAALSENAYFIVQVVQTDNCAKFQLTHRL